MTAVSVSASPEEVMSLVNTPTPDKAGGTPKAKAEPVQKSYSSDGKHQSSYSSDGSHANSYQATSNREEQQAKTDERPASTEGRPSWLPEKFKTPEDMAKSYAELEKKFSSGAGNEQPGAKTESTPASKEPVTGLEIEATPESKPALANVDYKALSKELAKDGKLSQKTREGLTKAGIPDSLIDTHVAGVLALQRQSEDKLLAEVGGRDSYKTMADWAKVNMSASDLADFNKAIAGGEASAKMALKALKASYTAANGKEPSLVEGDNTPMRADAYQSRDEMLSAMKDPRYFKDSKYRADVERKAMLMMKVSRGGA